MSRVITSTIPTTTTRTSIQKTVKTGRRGVVVCRAETQKQESAFFEWTRTSIAAVCLFFDRLIFFFLRDRVLLLICVISVLPLFLSFVLSFVLCVCLYICACQSFSISRMMGLKTMNKDPSNW